MSKLTDSFREVRVFNPYEFYFQGDPAKKVPYIHREYSRGRATYFYGWAVSLEGVNLYGPNPPYYVSDMHGGADKSFGASMNGAPGDRGKGALEAAQKWASERFGIEEWVRDPYGSYGPAEFVRERVAQLKALVREAS